MSKTLSAKYHQKNKERRQEKARKRYQNRSKKEEEKSSNMVVEVTKLSHKMKNKSQLRIEKNITEREKTLYYNYKKVF